MKIIKEVIKYQCEYCGASSKNQKDIEQHEKLCSNKCYKCINSKFAVLYGYKNEVLGGSHECQIGENYSNCTKRIEKSR